MPEPVRLLILAPFLLAYAAGMLWLLYWGLHDHPVYTIGAVCLLGLLVDVYQREKKRRAGGY